MALHEFRGPDSAASDSVQDVAIPSSSTARPPAFSRRVDERSAGRQRITAFARLIRPLPDGTCTVGRRTSRPSLLRLGPPSTLQKATRQRRDREEKYLLSAGRRAPASSFGRIDELIDRRKTGLFCGTAERAREI